MDFYHLTRDPAERLVPVLVEKCLNAGERVLLVQPDEKRRSILSKELWTNGSSSFHAHDYAGTEQEKYQPILISSFCVAPNDAKFTILADGKWRDEALSFKRIFLLFTAQEIEGARSAWRALSEKDDVETHYWKQDSGRWVEGP